MYNSLQSQISEINNQLTFILTALTKLTCDVNIQKESLSIVESNLIDAVSTLVQLTNDSETKQLNKESYTNEKNN
jgi:uncharacterized protein YoxC